MSIQFAESTNKKTVKANKKVVVTNCVLGKKNTKFNNCIKYMIFAQEYLFMLLTLQITVLFYFIFII